jgi:hypothetical protein
MSYAEISPKVLLQALLALRKHFQALTIRYQTFHATRVQHGVRSMFSPIIVHRLMQLRHPSASVFARFWAALWSISRWRPIMRGRTLTQRCMAT